MNDQDAFERVVNALHAASLDDTLWLGASALIDEACGTKGTMVTFGEELPNHTEFFFARMGFRGVDRSDWLDEYFRDFYAHDEHLPQLRALPDSKIVHVTDLFTAEELKTSRMFNDGLARVEGQNGLNVRLDGPCGSRISWGIADPVDSDGWSSSRLEMIAHILPHLRQYFRVRSALIDARALGASATELLDITRVGIVYLDRRGQIVGRNDTARRFLGVKGGLSDRGGELGAATPEDNAKLQHLLSRALPRFGGQGKSGSMMVGPSSLLPSFAVHVKPSATREEGFRSRRVAALVMIVDALGPTRIDPRLVQSVLGLTPAEAEVAVLLAEGRTTRQIAAAKGRGYDTVRTHLKHIFAKLRVSRQFEVAQLVLSLARLPVSRE